MCAQDSTSSSCAASASLSARLRAGLALGASPPTGAAGLPLCTHGRARWSRDVTAAGRPTPDPAALTVATPSLATPAATTPAAPLALLSPFDLRAASCHLLHPANLHSFLPTSTGRRARRRGAQTSSGPRRSGARAAGGGEANTRLSRMRMAARGGLGAGGLPPRCTWDFNFAHRRDEGRADGQYCY